MNSFCVNPQLPEKDIFYQYCLCEKRFQLPFVNRDVEITAQTTGLVYIMQQQIKNVVAQFSLKTDLWKKFRIKKENTYKPLKKLNVFSKWKVCKN